MDSWLPVDTKVVVPLLRFLGPAEEPSWLALLIGFSEAGVRTPGGPRRDASGLVRTAEAMEGSYEWPSTAR